jgi:hypothetical protein
MQFVNHCKVVHFLHVSKKGYGFCPSICLERLYKDLLFHTFAPLGAHA